MKKVKTNNVTYINLDEKIVNYVIIYLLINMKTLNMQTEKT